MLRSKGRQLTGLVLVLGAALVVGCGGGGAKPQTGAPAQAPTSGGSAAQALSQPPAAPVNVSITQAVDNLAFVPVYVARSKGYFTEEGMDADVTIVEGGNAATQAIVGRSAQFALSDTGEVTQANDKGVNLVSIETVMGKLTMNLVMRNDLAAQLGLSRQSSTDARLRALKDRTIGITSPGAATEVFSSYYLRTQGLDPDRDAKMVAVGGGPSLLAALKQGQIDAFMLSPPVPETAVADGYGTLLVSASQGDVPQLNEFAYEVLYARKDYLDQNRDTARHVARAIARGNNFTLDHTDAAREIMPTYFKVKPELLSEAMDFLVPAVPHDGLGSEAAWAKAIEIHQQAGMIKQKLDSREGTLWTNEYLHDLNGLSDR
ncbi:MAG TPA: ABC transporter substrate-binding protein [Chloroflexota bacterium]|jgi:ABC-type nitrate/sulfonate/bicarbonate transport system substrate-binding protein